MADELIPAETEIARVEAWRLHVLVEAGYPVAIAERIAVAPVELDDAVNLIRRGCAADLAARILL